ncbi:MAG: hypothetical protein CXZ00_10150 [Acidobacteria bacterium]|nr:MAG: hypothetical protein CXZ00_10150 [Acidobacteriota bacterium]
MKLRNSNFIRVMILVLVSTISVPSPLAAQHIRQDASGRVVPDFGDVRMSEEDQIKLGQRVSAEVYKQMPVLPASSQITRYVQHMGERLAAKAPGTRWPFEFRVIAQKEINAFALPGGPIFVNLGTIQAADEGELAGVMAHEIAHVVMQHTARDARKQQTTRTIGAIGSMIAGAVLGSGIGGTLASGAIQIGAGAISMKYTRADENEADLLGAQIMYDAGYNPYSMAEFFQKLAQQNGGGIQFLSDHPNPGNRAEAVRNVIQKFPQKSYPRSDSQEFVAMKRVAGETKAYTAQEIANHKGSWNLSDAAPGEKPNPGSGSIETVSYAQVRPSGAWNHFDQGGLAFDHPANWRLSNKNDEIIVAPPAGISSNGAIAYGLSIYSVKSGVSSAEIAGGIVEGNPGMKILVGPNRLRVNGVEATSYDLIGNSPIVEAGSQAREHDWLVTIPRGDGSTIVLIFTTPERDYAEMKRTFQTMLRSFRVH